MVILAFKRIDLQTYNPRKLFRSIVDIVDDHMRSRGYTYDESDIMEPKLEKTALDDIADFKGSIHLAKSYKSAGNNMIIGIIIIAIGGLTFLIGYIPNTGMGPALLGAILIIVGIIIALKKKQAVLLIEILMKGESYKARGGRESTRVDAKTDEEKQSIQVKNNLTGSDVERSERLGVISDVRITLRGGPERGSYFNEKYHGKELDNDLRFLSKKLEELSTSFQIRF